MKTILMITEKPTIAEALALALAEGREVMKGKGVSPAVPVFQFEAAGAPFLAQGEKVWCKVTSCAGHVYKTEFTKQYLDRKTVDPGTLFEAATEKLEESPGQRMPAHFKNEAKGCYAVCLWLDCDREGENICFEVLRSAVNNDGNDNSIN